MHETAVIGELIRVQLLVLVSRSDRDGVGPVTLRELSDWLRVPLEEGCAMATELCAEGLVELDARGPPGAHTALRPTRVGEGWVHWIRHHHPFSADA